MAASRCSGPPIRAPRRAPSAAPAGVELPRAARRAVRVIDLRSRLGVRHRCAARARHAAEAAEGYVVYQRRARVRRRRAPPHVAGGNRGLHLVRSSTRVGRGGVRRRARTTRGRAQARRQHPRAARRGRRAAAPDRGPLPDRRRRRSPREQRSPSRAARPTRASPRPGDARDRPGRAELRCSRGLGRSGRDVSRAAGPRVDDHWQHAGRPRLRQAALLGSGRVLVMGGFQSRPQRPSTIPRAARGARPGPRSWRAGATAANLLPDGSVLLTGGIVYYDTSSPDRDLRPGDGDVQRRPADDRWARIPRGRDRRSRAGRSSSRAAPIPAPTTRGLRPRDGRVDQHGEPHEPSDAPSSRGGPRERQGPHLSGGASPGSSAPPARSSTTLPPTRSPRRGHARLPDTGTLSRCCRAASCWRSATTSTAPRPPSSTTPQPSSGAYTARWPTGVTSTPRRGSTTGASSWPVARARSPLQHADCTIPPRVPGARARFQLWS